MATHTLDFERPLLEIERQIEELRKLGGGDGASRNRELAPPEKQLAELRAEIYRQPTPMQRGQVARHPKRPDPLHYIRLPFTDFVELHGHRLIVHYPASV